MDRHGLCCLPAFGLALTALIAAVFATGCLEGGNDIETLIVQGSTTVMPIAQRAAEAYMDAHENADIQVSGGGSGVGVKAAGEGTAGIGMASRDLTHSEMETYPEIVKHVIARDGIAIIVHSSNPVPKLTIAQVRGLYNGTFTNWKDVGGSDLPVVAVGRDSASGTREFFWEHVMGREDFVSTMQQQNSNGAVFAAVKETPGAIGFVGLGYVQSGVRGVPIENDGENVDPTVANVVNGKYPISRSLYFLTKGEPSGLAKAFIDFVMSSEGQSIVEEEGFVPV